jgi:hypothetical protein
MTTILYNYDPTSVSSDNLVKNELHNVLDSTARVIVARHGLFYAKSLSVRHVATGDILVHLTDYRIIALDPWITAKTTHECCAGIEFLSASLSGNVEITYQAVGGKEGYYSALLKELTERIQALSERDVDWQDILNKPTEYPPEPHPHEVLTDLTGLQALRNALANLTDTLTNRRGPIYSGFDINSKLERLLALLGELNKLVSMLGMYRNKFATTLEYGMVRLASLSEVFDSAAGNKVITTTTLDAKIATTLKRGLIKIASLSSALAKEADDEAITPKTLWGVISNELTISLNKQVISEDYTLPDNYNGDSIGPVTVTDKTLTIKQNQLWKVTDKVSGNLGALDPYPQYATWADYIPWKNLTNTWRINTTTWMNSTQAWLSDSEAWKRDMAAWRIDITNWRAYLTSNSWIYHDGTNTLVTIPLLASGVILKIQVTHIGVAIPTYNEYRNFVWGFDNTCFWVHAHPGSLLSPQDVGMYGLAVVSKYTYIITHTNTGLYDGSTHGTWLIAIGY